MPILKLLPSLRKKKCLLHDEIVLLKKLVHYYFTVWKKPKESGQSLLEEILKKISTKNSNCRWEKGKNKFCSYSQSVKNTDTAKEKGYDAGEKISGIKRHITVDSQGLPHAIWN